MILRKKKTASSDAKPTLKAAHYAVIERALVTEKSTRAMEQNKVVFRVKRDADKTQVKEAVEALFGVKVVKVNTINQPGKMKRFRGREAYQQDTKKALVTLAEGQSIDLAAGVK